MHEFEKIVIVTKKTGLEELIERFNTREQARFYLEHMGTPFEQYLAAHDAYKHALDKLKGELPQSVRAQFIERAFLPTFTFGEHDLVATLGPDGLVVNTAKYLTTQPLLALNPDPQRIDGVLIPFRYEQAGRVLREVVRGNLMVKKISMAKAQLNDNQTLYAVNDLFIGHSSHVSARYRLQYQGRAEDQSSSGIIVSTGAGSTGWLRSVITGAQRISSAVKAAENAPQMDDGRFDWEAEHLVFSVREPFISKVSSAHFVFGHIDARQTFEITSNMPQSGVIFSDGVQEDYLEFNSGAVARITVAEKKLHLIMHV